MPAEIPENRKLNAEEFHLLRWLLENSAKQFLSQLNHVRVVSRCGCGCPSIHFEIEDKSLTAEHNGRTISHLHGKTSDGMEVGGMIWVEHGRLAGLEVYCYGENLEPFGLPTIESLTFTSDRIQ